MDIWWVGVEDRMSISQSHPTNPTVTITSVTVTVATVVTVDAKEGVGVNVVVNVVVSGPVRTAPELEST